MKAKPAQGKGRKPSSASKASIQKFDAVVKVGTAITFAPTGERVRITKIADGKITFEKLP